MDLPHNLRDEVKDHYEGVFATVKKRLSSANAKHMLRIEAFERVVKSDRLSHNSSSSVELMGKDPL